MRNADVQLQTFEESVTSFKDPSKDKLTLKSGTQAGERLNSLVKAFRRPKEAQALLGMYRGPAGVADEAAAVFVARKHGQPKAVESFFQMLRSLSADDVIRSIEQCIITCQTRTARASLAPTAPNALDDDESDELHPEAPEVPSDGDDDDVIRPGVNPDIDIDNPEDPSGGED